MEQFIVSARKYRPANFKSVIGQASLTATLKNAIAQKHLAHAYLFCGPRGVGKTTCARIFAKMINCMNPTPQGDACEVCESCKAFNEQRSFNIHEMDAASNNSVDEMRSLTDQVRIPPQVGKYSVYIIDEVHMLSSSAFNAFLKTLEEPPAHVIFVLATTEKHKILPTILSRCQIYDFNRIRVQDTVEYLQYVAGNEGVQAEVEALNVIAQKADGAMRDALSIFDQVVSFCGNNVTYDAAIANLNVLDYVYYFKLVDLFLKGDVSNALLIFNEILVKGFDANYFVTGLATHMRDLLVCKDPQTVILLEVADSVQKQYVDQAQRCPDAFIFKALEFANNCDLQYRVSRNKRLLVELMLVRMSQIMIPIESSVVSQTQMKPLQAQPAASTSTSQAASVRPQTVTPSESTPEVAPSAVASSRTQQPSNTRPSTAMNTAAMRNTSPLPRISINPSNLSQGGAPEAEHQPQQRQAKVQYSEKPFNLEGIIKAWRAYAAKVEEPHLQNTMLNFLPEFETGQYIVKVVNEIQLKSLGSCSRDINLFLRKELDNSSVTLSIIQDDTIAQRQAFTPEEKFQSMKEKNPTLARMHSELGLELD